MNGMIMSVLFSFIFVLLLFGGTLALFIIDKNVATVNIIEFIFHINPGF